MNSTEFWVRRFMLSAAALRGKNRWARVSRGLWSLYLALAHGFLPVSVWRGATYPRGRQGSLLAVGKEPWVCHLPERFFIQGASRETIGRFPVWTLPAKLQRIYEAVDMTVVRTSRFTTRLFTDTEYLHAPEWIDALLYLPSGPHEPAAIEKRTPRGDMRLIRRNRLQAFVSHDPSEFDRFYFDMHVPFVKKRFGAMGVSKGYHALRSSMQRGAMIWICRGDERLAATVVERCGRQLRLRALGTKNGDPAVARQGAIAAIYHFSLAFAREQGCRIVRLGTSRAVLQDGVLRYKRKWGGTFLEKPDMSFHLLLRWNRLEGPVAGFLSHTSPIFKQPEGLAAVVALDTQEQATAADAKAAFERLWVRGLERLYLVGPEGWAPGVYAPPGTVLVDARNAGRLPLNARKYCTS